MAPHRESDKISSHPIRAGVPDAAAGAFLYQTFLRPGGAFTSVHMVGKRIAILITMSSGGTLSAHATATDG